MICMYVKLPYFRALRCNSQQFQCYPQVFFLMDDCCPVVCIADPQFASRESFSQGVIWSAGKVCARRCSCHPIPRASLCRAEAETGPEVVWL